MKVTISENSAPLPGSVETDPVIPSEVPPDDGLNIGAITPNEVPEERLGSYSPEGQDTDFSSQVRPEIRKPDQFEKFVACIRQVMETVLLVQRVGVKGYETRYYYVDEMFRPMIGQGFKGVVVLPCWSIRDRRWFLWIINASEASSYFANLRPFLEQEEEFYKDASFTVETDKEGGRYKFMKFKETKKFPASPGRTTGQMLGQALGQRGRINSINHPAIAELTGGEEVYL
jgi:hypothetical protein